jgi:hypothetical protein
LIGQISGKREKGVIEKKERKKGKEEEGKEGRVCEQRRWKRKKGGNLQLC